MKKTRKEKNFSGFTVVELIVVISIFTIMLSVSTFNYRDTQKKVEATNLAEDIALTMRQAQVYGISASEGALAGDSFEDINIEADYFDRNSNGIDITNDTSIRGIAIELGTNNVYLFKDVDENYLFESDTDILIDTRRVYSSDVSINSIGLCDSMRCYNVNESGAILSISFKRPYPDAYIMYRGKSYNSADINIGDSRDNNSTLRIVSVNSIGNIYVKNNAGQ